MSMSPRSVKVARFAPILALGVGWLVVAGCGPPEAGSVRVPEEQRRGLKPMFGPGAVQAKARGPGPGQARVEPKAKPVRRRGGAPIRPRIHR